MSEGKTTIRVCKGRTCSCFGSERIMQKIEEQTGVKAGESNELYDVDYCLCLARCAHAANVEVDDVRIIGHSDPNTIMNQIADPAAGYDSSGTEIDIDEIIKL